MDILNNPPSKEILVSAKEVYGDRKFLLNTSGLIYRSIGAEAVKKLSDNQFYENLYKKPRLIKRPFLYKNNNCLLVGFKENKWVEKLL